MTFAGADSSACLFFLGMMPHPLGMSMVVEHHFYKRGTVGLTFYFSGIGIFTDSLYYDVHLISGISLKPEGGFYAVHGMCLVPFKGECVKHPVDVAYAVDMAVDVEVRHAAMVVEADGRFLHPDSAVGGDGRHLGQYSILETAVGEVFEVHRLPGFVVNECPCADAMSDDAAVGIAEFEIALGELSENTAYPCGDAVVLQTSWTLLELDGKS